MDTTTAFSAKRIEVDKDIVWFFMDNGSAVAIKHDGISLEVIKVEGAAKLLLSKGVELTLSSGERDALQQDPAQKQADPFAVFHLLPPVKISDVDAYRDGGTVKFTILDARGNRLQGGYSRKLGEHPRPFYVGAEYQGDSSAKRLPIGGAEETALVAILSSWLEQHLSLEEQKFLAEYGILEMATTRHDFLYILEAIKETEARRIGA